VDQDSEARSTVLPLIWCPPHRDQLHLDARVKPMSEPSLRSSFRRRYWEEELLLYTTCLNDCGLFLIERYQLRAVDLEESSSRESRRIKRIGGDQQHLEELQLRPTFHQQANASRRPLAHRVPRVITISPPGQDEGPDMGECSASRRPLVRRRRTSPCLGLLSRGSVRIRALRQKGQHDAFSHPTRALGTAAPPAAVPRREHPRVARLPRITSLLTTATLSWSNGATKRPSGYQKQIDERSSTEPKQCGG